MSVGNLFRGECYPQAEELTELLTRGHKVQVERIVSSGHSSPQDFWYDQEQCEWVALLQGSARLRFEDESGPRTLVPGDYVQIDAHRRHRVEWTSPDKATIWLAVYFDPLEDGQ